VFLSHAGAQKRDFVAFLLEGLENKYPPLKGKVFMDENSLRVGGAAFDTMYKALQDAVVGKEKTSSCQSFA
jgi:hypothetical protein